MPLALLYHDVTAAGQDDASGFPGAGAARYKLTGGEFARHVMAIARNTSTAPVTALGLPKLPDRGRRARLPACCEPWLLTFDDGGVSAYSEIAHLLEQHRWPGHFFVTAGRIDTPTFLSTDQICDLAARGHIIGTHSWSHPARMSCCSWDELVEEWARSREILSNILGQSVIVGSVPGGYYSPKVADAAAFAGIRILFTSEPTPRSWRVDNCLVLGRYTIYRGMPANTAGAIAAGKYMPRFRQSCFWSLKKLAKLAGGRAYLDMRRRLLARQYPAVAVKDVHP